MLRCPLAIFSWKDIAGIPPLRGPTRQKAARKRKSGRYGPFGYAQGRRDDKVGLPQKLRLYGPFGYAQGSRDDTIGEERTHPCTDRKDGPRRKEQGTYHRTSAYIL
jgi:hypothetical protein